MHFLVAVAPPTLQDLVTQLLQARLPKAPNIHMWALCGHLVYICVVYGKAWL